jgi:colicin import membrane protein
MREPHEAPAAPPPAPGKRISITLAVAMHILLAVLLIYGVHWQTQKQEVVAVDLVSVVPPAPSSVPTAKPEPKPEPKPVAKPEPKQEPPKPVAKPDIAQKEKEKPKPEPKPEPPKPVPPDPFQEQLKREADELQKLKAAAAAAQEQAKQVSAAQAGDMDKYIAAIRGKVRGNLVLPPDIKGNPEAEFEVTQLPSGDVLNVRLVKSSGHAAYDAATERAIRKSTPLPKPVRSELFARSLILKFRPLED